MKSCCAIGISYANQCSWSITVDCEKYVSVREKKKIIKLVMDHAHLQSNDDIDEVLIVNGDQVIHHWTAASSDWVQSFPFIGEESTCGGDEDE